MPVYNRERYVTTAIQSILKQSYPYFQLIIYDDGSTDDTEKFIKTFKDDGRIVYLKGEKNHGVPYARNRLLEAVDTRFACWQDSDDISNIHRLEHQVWYLLLEMKKLICANYEVYRGNEYEKKVIRTMEWCEEPDCQGKNKIGFATTMFEVDKAITFDEQKILGGEDMDWLKRMEAKHGKPWFLPYKLYYIRFHGDRVGYWKRIIMPQIKTLSGNKLSYEELLKSYGH